MGCIYLVTNSVNGMQYVGKTRVGIRSRINDHLCQVRRGYNNRFHNALRKYGFDAFEWMEVYSDVPDDKLDDLECECIKWYGTRSPNGYNLTDGGEGVPGWKPHLNWKIGKSRLFAGVSKSPEHRKKISMALMGKPKSDQARRNMSIGGKGKKTSEETRAKRREIAKSRTRGVCGRFV